MVERLKRWESPRNRGRNDKGKGGSARARQLRKREQMLRQKLKNNAETQQTKQTKQKGDKPNGMAPLREREIVPSLFFGETKLVFLRSRILSTAALR
ncbi:MAG: hypothetical protein QNJ53_01270 [Pleurocapsa sp. MO_192.B19]|nr:hypothetical protein [Pleurocapsa sp. MO_192.B19]